MKPEPFTFPHILVKSDLRNGRADSFDAFDNALPLMKEIGFHGTEVAITITGDPYEDGQVLEKLQEWVKRWYDAGLNVYVHPYTSGVANPAMCTEVGGGVPHDAFRRVADVTVELARQRKESTLLTYHAAEFKPAESTVDSPSREELLRRSVHFFDLGFTYVDGLDVRLTSETQLPPTPGSSLIRIGDRPDEVSQTLVGRRTGTCWDSGHYILSAHRVGIPLEPTAAFVDTVTHMHIHDVIEGKDHHPISPQSHQVAQYVALASSSGSLRSITLEYNYARDTTAVGPTEEMIVVDHLRKAFALVRDWCAMRAH